MGTAAKVIADSITHDGVRLTTIEVVMHRFVLAEFNTHRVFSRNSASSRAIPVAKQIERIWREIAYPVSWPVEQKGMQGGDELSPEWSEVAKTEWRNAAINAIHSAKVLKATGVHKSVTNRVLEPYMWHTVVVTATAYKNWDSLRLDPAAQPEIRVAAQAMAAARAESTPQILAEGEWHLPYVSDEDKLIVAANVGREFLSEDEVNAKTWETLKRISSARCARTSYLTQDGVRDLNEDLVLYDRLVTDNIAADKGIHWSPLEHVATPWPWNRQEGCIHFGQEEHLVGIKDTFTCITLDHLPRVGNLVGWRQFRIEVEAANNARTFT